MCDKCVEWNGIRWHSYNNGYYEYRGTRSKQRKDRDNLHKAKFKHYFGEIPKGYDVHHKDGNKLNNEISNLELLSRSEHMRHHREESPIPRPDFESMRHETNCQDCGKVVERKVVTETILCKQCQFKKADKRRTHERSCSFCGETFRTIRGNFCSQRCVNLGRRDRANSLQH